MIATNGFIVFDFFARRFQQEFEKFSQQHTADMAELKQAHEAEMAASRAREEANLTQVNERKADRKVSKSKPEAVSSLHRSCAAMRSSSNQRTKSRQDEISISYDYNVFALLPRVPAGDARRVYAGPACARYAGVAGPPATRASGARRGVQRCHHIKPLTAYVFAGAQAVSHGLSSFPGSFLRGCGGLDVICLWI